MPQTSINNGDSGLAVRQALNTMFAELFAFAESSGLTIDEILADPALNAPGGTSEFLRGDGIWAQPAATPRAAHFIPPLVATSIITAAMNATAPTTVAGAANRLDFIPFIPSRNLVIDQLGIEVTTLIASSLARVAIYADNNGTPGALLAGGANALDCATTGIKTESISLSMTAGTLYWLAVWTSSTQTLRALGVASCLPLTLNTTTWNNIRRATLAFGAMPANAPVAVLSSGSIPIVRMRLGS
jgi:hypothetical protein